MAATMYQCFFLTTLLCLLARTTAFLPTPTVWRNAGSTSMSTTRLRVAPASRQLLMGFDFGKMMEKMSDTRYARCRHILIEEKGEDAQARLEELKADIAGDLDKFSEVATNVSTCTSAKNGGRLKLLARSETVPEFDKVLFTQEPGNIYGPIETVYGTHLIYLESCNKPQNTWKMLYDDIVKKVTGKESEETKE